MLNSAFDLIFRQMSDCVYLLHGAGILNYATVESEVGSNEQLVKQPVSQTPQQCQWRVWGKGNWNCLHGTQINRDIHIRTKCICISNKI